MEKRRRAASSLFAIRNSPFAIRTGFTLIEIMVVVALLSLIIIALMGVFNSTQAAFRASVTQTDVLEGGRAAMDLITSDLRAMTPSDGYGTTNNTLNPNGIVNFCVRTNSYGAGYTPLYQALFGATDSNTRRTNVLESFFILSHQNTKWSGIGYSVVGVNLQNDLYALYRTNFPSTNNLQAIYYCFTNFLANPTVASHLIDGVVHLRVSAFDNNGAPIVGGTNVVTYRLNFTSPDQFGYVFYSNKVPASVEIEMGVLEDRTLQRAESLPTTTLQNNYLLNQAGKVHVFRQRVTIPNVDPAAYQ